MLPSISLDLPGRDPKHLGQGIESFSMRLLGFLAFDARKSLGRDSGKIAYGKPATARGGTRLAAKKGRAGGRQETSRGNSLRNTNPRSSALME